MKKIAILLIIIISLPSLFAKANTVRYPFMAYSDDTSVMIGGFNLVTFRDSTFLAKQAPNLWITNAIYSFKNQYLLFTKYNYKVKDSSFRIEPFLKYEKWPTEFYELGNNSKFDSEEKIILSGFDFQLHLNYLLNSNYTFKGGLLLNNYTLSDISDNSYFKKNKIMGIKGGVISGISFSIDYDTRDNSQYPSNGWYVNFENKMYNSIFLSDYNFSKHSITIKKILDLNHNFILANQIKGSLVLDNAPFYEYNKLGEDLRAFNENRFNDRYLISYKSELRNFPFREGFWQRFGWVVFLETGQVSNSYKSFTKDEFKLSIGSGIRFSLIPQEKMNLRIDVAYGTDGIGVNFIAQEDF
jgi:outer membrane translocation and assembly module TamA